MEDIVDVLRALPHPAPPVAGTEIAAADLARARRALMRRRRNRIRYSGLAVAAVAAVAVSVTQLAQPQGSQPVDTGNSGATTQQASAIRLVAFTGTQPIGFKVSTVPAGWRVISSNEHAFVVAPPGSDAPAAVPQASGSQNDAGGSSVSYDGRIAVMLQGMSRLASDKPVTKVSINGRDGLLGYAAGTKAGSPNSGAVWLIFPDAAGNKILVQVPTSVGLTNDQIVTFAQGITVTADAHSVGG